MILKKNIIENDNATKIGRMELNVLFLVEVVPGELECKSVPRALLDVLLCSHCAHCSTLLYATDKSLVICVNYFSS